MVVFMRAFRSGYMLMTFRSPAPEPSCRFPRRSCRLAERQRRSCSAPVRVETPAGRRRLTRGRSRPSISSTGYNVLRAGGVLEPRGAHRRCSRASSRRRGARGVAVFGAEPVEARQIEAAVGALRGACRRPAGAARRRAPRSSASSVCVVSSDDAVRRVSGQEVRALLTSRLFLADLLTDASQSGAGAARLGSRVGDRRRRGDPRTTRTSPSGRKDIERPGRRCGDDVLDADTRVAPDADACREWSRVARRACGTDLRRRSAAWSSGLKDAGGPDSSGLPARDRGRRIAAIGASPARQASSSQDHRLDVAARRAGRTYVLSILQFRKGSFVSIAEWC